MKTLKTLKTLVLKTFLKITMLKTRLMNKIPK